LNNPASSGAQELFFIFMKCCTWLESGVCAPCRLHVRCDHVRTSTQHGVPIHNRVLLFTMGFILLWCCLTLGVVHRRRFARVEGWV